MNSDGTDIIIPVWNRPIETRECLAALVEHAADARLILLNRGSDPETERVIHEFAEYLDDRMILLRTGGALGFVETLNKGLSLADAPLMIVLSPTSLVSSGWLEPLRTAALRPDAGILVPRIEPRERGRSRRRDRNKGIPEEACRGTFAAMGITARLYEKTGGPDPGLDGDLWCLSDFSRRADRAGFRTLFVDTPPVLQGFDVAYGSAARIERVRTESGIACRARWGEEREYCLCLDRDPGRDEIDSIFASVLSGSRRGHRFFILAPFRAHRAIVAAGLHRLHENIFVQRLSRCFPQRSFRSAFARLRETRPGLTILTGMEGLTDPGGAEGVPFAVLENQITAGRSE